MSFGPMVYRGFALGLCLAMIPAANAGSRSSSSSSSSSRSSYSAPSPSRSYTPSPAPPYRPPSPPPAATRPAAPPPSVTREATPPPAVTKQATPPPAVTKQATPPPAVTKQPPPPPSVTKTATPPPAVTPPPKVNQDNFKQALPPGTTAGEFKRLPGGGTTSEIKDSSGKVVGHSTFDANKQPKTTTFVDKNGNTVVQDHHRDIKITTTPNGDKIMVRGSGANAVTTVRTNPANNGPQTITTTTGGVKDVYTAQPSSWGSSNHVTVIHQYQPVGGYWGGGCDLFCLMLITSMNNHHYSNDNQYYPPNYNPQAAPRNLDYNWTKLYPNLPSELAIKKTYTDAVDWVGDSVTLGMIESVRDGGIERQKETKKEECTFLIFGCHEVAVPGSDADKFSTAYLEALRNFNLDSNARTDITDHAGKILGVIQQKKEVALADLIDPKTGDVKDKRVYIFQDAKPMTAADGSSCTLAFGDVVKLQKGNPDDGTVSLEVMQSANSADVDSCHASTVVAMDVSDFQDMENTFAHRVEKALNESKQVLASASIH
jgi:hypothetical protein